MHPTDGGSTSVPSFITKLWKLVNETKYADLITWSVDGKSFTIKDQSRFAKELLPLYFKHSNMGSFVRQLNMYGFRKMTNIDNSGLRPGSDAVSFHHTDFVRGQEMLLEQIRRKKNLNSVLAADGKVPNGFHTNTSQAVSTTGTANDVQNQLATIMQRQDSLDKFRLVIQQENSAIWKEIAFLRRQNNEQQNVIQNLIKFLISLVPQMRNLSGKRKASLINSMANSVPDPKRLNTGSPSSSSSQGLDAISLSTIRNGILDAIRNGLSDPSEAAGSSNGVMIQDVTDDELAQELQTLDNNTIIPHSSNSESAPILTESDMDLLSQVCKQLNLMPPAVGRGKSSAKGQNNTVSAKNIVEVPEDFTLVPETDPLREGDELSDFVDEADDLLFTAAETIATCVQASAPDAKSLPVDQPLNDPLDLDSLDLGVQNPEDFVLPDLSSPLVEDPESSFSLLL